MTRWLAVMAAIAMAAWTSIAAAGSCCGGDKGKGTKGGEAPAPTNAPSAQVQSQAPAAQ